MILIEGRPQQSQIQKGLQKFYKLEVKNKKVLEVKFQLTQIHGDADIYTSRTDSFPGPLRHDKESAKSGLVPDSIAYT